MEKVKALKERNFKAALIDAVEKGIPFFPEVGDPVIVELEDLPTSHKSVTWRHYKFQGFIATGEESLEFIWALASVSNPRFGFSYEMCVCSSCGEESHTLLIWTKE